MHLTILLSLYRSFLHQASTPHDKWSQDVVFLIIDKNFRNFELRN